MENQLIFAMRIGLFEYIYHATPNRRWLSLHLRWRLVSKRFNHYILHLDYGYDPFLRSMLHMHSSLIYADESYVTFTEYGGRLWRKLVSLFQVLEHLDHGIYYDEKHWTSIVRTESAALAILEVISLKRLWNEFHLWRQARPRVHFPLVVRPADLSPDAFIESYRLTIPYSNLLRSRQFDSPERARCFHCWRVSGRRKLGTSEFYRFYGEPLTGMVMDATYQCSPCETAQSGRISLVREAAVRMKEEGRVAKRKFDEEDELYQHE